MKSREELIQEKKETIEKAAQQGRVLLRRLERVLKYKPTEEKREQFARIIFTLGAQLVYIRNFILAVQAQPLPPKFPIGGVISKGEEAIIKRRNN